MKVSIAMVTYNHEQFISKALDSVLMQQTNFDYEIVIGEDCSSDGTRAIVIDYQKRFPDKFRLLLNEQNIGMHKNGAQTVQACKGEYVAMLEGDDYWISPDKLQKQVDFLERHPECVICFHNAEVVYQDGSHETELYCHPRQKKISTAVDLLVQGNFMPTCSKMYRAALLGNVPEWVSSLKMGDWPIDILISQHGKIGYINEIMGVYVIHKGGVWYEIRKNWEENSKANIEMYEKMYDALPYNYRGLVKHILHERCVDNAEQYESLGELEKGRKYALKAFADHFVISKRMLKILLKICAPNIFNLLKFFRQLKSS